MKRVLLILILLTLVEMTGMVFLGKYVLQSKVEVLPENTDIYYARSDNSSYYDVRFSYNEKTYKREMTKVEYQEFIRTRTFRWFPVMRHIWPVALSIALLIFFIWWWVLRFFDLEDMYYKGVFHTYSWNSNLCNSRARLYTLIANYDLSSLKQKFFAFWGH